MNTNQDATLTNQDFEKWFNDFHIDEIPMYKTIKDFAFSGYMHATKASEQRIQELEAEVMKAQSYFMKSQRELRELQAHVNQLREALKLAKVTFISNNMDVRNVMEVIDTNLSSTPDQSLAEHDNKLIDRCKNIVADDALAITFQSMGAYRSEIIRQLGELKATL